jgi:hypothetical protein
MNTQFTITLNVDIAKISEVYEALQLVDGVHIGSVESSTAIITNGNGNGHSSEAVKTKVKTKPQTKRKTSGYQKRKKSVLYTDPRAVLLPPSRSGAWASLNHEATLKNLGITADELEAMETRNGTLECALKRSIGQKGGAK